MHGAIACGRHACVWKEGLLYVLDKFVFTLANGKLAIATAPKTYRAIDEADRSQGYFEAPKRVPGDAVMEEVDNSEKLGDVEASEYRSCVGILLYLATGLPHAQHSMRHLSTGMSSPTKHLVFFLEQRTYTYVLIFEEMMLDCIIAILSMPMRCTWKFCQILIGDPTNNIGSL